MGRPQVPQEERAVTITITLRPDVVSWLEDTGRNRSQLINELLLKEKAACTGKTACENPKCRAMYNLASWRYYASQNHNCRCPFCGPGQKWLLNIVKTTPLTDEEFAEPEEENQPTMISCACGASYSEILKSCPKCKKVRE